MSRKFLSLGLLSFLAFSPSLVSASRSQSECYSNIGDLKVHMGSTFQSLGMCQSHCGKQDFSVYGVKGDRCWCGDKLPPVSAKVSQKECNEPCPGFPSDTCGGDDVWTIIYDSSTDPEHSKPQSSSSEPKPSSSTSEPKVIMSINPNLVATGAAFTQTSIPNSILTAPTTAPKNADVAEPSALAATQASSSSSSSSSSASSSADPESSSNGAAGPASPAAVGSIVGAILLPLVLGSAF
ncbi:hypothetical protein N8T08_004875 [Aspergillus melleus]|uniref:Uncharacterized protein n=1 Tax=Aspergillus melleus TaxID=138277 RepID=A0ACC3B3J9_9EURO|nr:hypothetical protein N8T08_004875 [Aspergillus melleus]